MSLSKKHFEAVAKIINDNCLIEHEKKQILVNAFCNYFKSENKNFNSFRFHNACFINELGSSKPETVINTVEALKKVSKESIDAEDIEKGLYDLDELNITREASLVKKAIDEVHIEDLQKEIKVLKSKVKTYEKDINKRLEEVEVQNFENDLNSVKN